MIKSKSWWAMMSYWISSKSLWTMVTLFVFWLKSCSCWTGNTSFTVPKGFIIWAHALIVKEDFSSNAFTSFGGWIDWSWGGTVTLTPFSVDTVFGTFWAFFALLRDWIKELSSWWVTFDTIGSYLIITFSTF